MGSDEAGSDYRAPFERERRCDMKQPDRLLPSYLSRSLHAVVEDPARYGLADDCHS